jgi:O-antigen/teichoic acid export membrane protein
MRKDLAVIATGGLVSLGGLALFRLAGLVTKVVLGRLGPENYGAFSIAVAAFTLLALCAAFGFDAGIARFGAAAPAKERARYAATAFRVTIPLSVALAAGLWLSSDWAGGAFASPLLAVILRWFALALPLVAFARVVMGMLASQRAVVGHAMLSSISESVMRLAVVLALVVFGWGVLGGIVAYVAGFAALFVAAIVCIRAYRLQVLFRGAWDVPLLTYAAPFFGITAIILLLRQLDTFFLGFLRGTASAGIYNAAVPLSSQLLVGAMVLMPFFVPTLAARVRAGQPVTKLYQQITKWVLMLTVPGVLFLVVFASPVVLLLFGEAYREAIPVLQLLAPAYFLFALTLPSRELARIRRKHMPRVFLVVCGVFVLDTALNLLFIPRYGLLGAAGSSLVTMLVLSAAWVVLVRVQSQAWPLARSHARVVFAAFLSLVPAALLYFLTIPLGSVAAVVALVAMAMAYVPALFLCQALDAQDLAVLAKFAQRAGLPFVQRWLE